MSPHVHALPAPENFGSVGEYEFAQRLQTICGSDTHLWFRLDYIPGTREIDVLLCLEGVGAFAIEVKAVTLDAIESCGAGEMVRVAASVTGSTRWHRRRMRCGTFSVTVWCGITRKILSSSESCSRLLSARCVPKDFPR